MPTVLEDLTPRTAPLEYWFIKLHSGPLAFLVDLIVRRGTGQAEVRVSLWVRGQGRVARTRTTTWRTATTATAASVVSIAECALGAHHSAGMVEDVAWDLRYECQAGRAAPTVPLLSRLHPFDLDLVSRPAVRFGGHVTVSGERFDIADAGGSLTHYWGRRLADRWHWISADHFGESDLNLEAVTLRTRLWGRHPRMAAGYLWMREAGREQILISPLTGLITVTGALTDYTLVARRPGSTTRLRCRAPAECYNDLGEGIHQALLGSCAIVDRDLADSHAGLEYRIG